MPLVTRRGQGVLLKNPFWDRNTNELTVQVALLFSKSMTIAPRLVLIVAWYAALKSGVADGVPTFLAAGGLGVYTQCVAGSLASVGVGVGVGVGVVFTDGDTDGVDSALALELLECVSAITPTTTTATTTRTATPPAVHCVVRRMLC